VIEQEQSLILNVRGGARLCVPASLDQITTYVLLEQEDWFEDEIRFVRRWLRPGMRAVDVGANIGVYTFAMAQAVGSSGRVWAFEPTPAAADRLERNLELNASGQVSMSRVAVSAHAGMVAFATGAHSELNAIVDSAGGSRGELQVQAVTLDQMAAAHGWSDVDFVKLDVEGHEIEAIQGGARYFASASPLVMLEVKAGDRVNLEMLDPLSEMGYDVYRLLPGPLMLARFDPSEPVDGFLLNLFACKSDRAHALAERGLLAAIDTPGAASTKGAFAAFARSAPYARDLGGGWRSSAGMFSSPDLRTYLEGLAAFAHSRDARLAPAERLAWLNRALQCVADAIESNDTLARRLSYARLAAELGWRTAAVSCLGLAVERLAADGEKALQGPFLSPSERYERLASGEPLAWLKCAVVEQFEKLRQYSSLYAGITSLEILEPIRDLAYRSAEIDRRRNLVRMRHGMQSAPESSPLLRAATEENLNPRFWGPGA
jgi:FkbM family methyltransferase